MKKLRSKPTPPVIVPIRSKDLQKDYALTPAEAKNAIAKLSGLYAKRQAQGKISEVKGRIRPDYFD